MTDHLLQLQQLKAKFDHTGQDMASYLDGLLLSNYLNYWDYVRLDTLLSLQAPRTDFPDEKIFIVYHQITELYFNLCLHELEQIAVNGVVINPDGQLKGTNTSISAEFLTERLRRINAYFESLTKSFEIMIRGMEPGQFLRFRMALLPASGFQSAQYRMIELASTDLIQLVDGTKREALTGASFDEQFQFIYWKNGATEAATGKKTLTLQQFEAKYSAQLLAMAQRMASCNVRRKLAEIPETDRTPALLTQMRQLDVNVNVNWPLVHYKSAVRYLQGDQPKSDAPATGGTNWQRYLPPRHQRRIFFPELFSQAELSGWGQGWVTEVGADYIKTADRS